MKIFLIIVTTIVIISALVVGYIYNKFTYKPDYFQTAEQVEIWKVAEQAKEIEKRVTEDLESEGYAKLSGDDIMKLEIIQLEAETNIEINSIVKKTKSEIIDGKLKSEAVINIKALSLQNVSGQARQYINTFMQYVPDTMMEEVYVSFEGTPVNENGTIRFSKDMVISVGDIIHTTFESQDNDIEIDLDLLHKINASQIVIRDNYIEIIK